MARPTLSIRVSFTRGIDGPRFTPLRSEGRVATVHEHKRRSTRRSEVGTGTLACRRCDAPVAIGGASLGPADAMSCPFCGHSGAVREFLSLAAPVRPARVVVKVIER
jgi:hypothetical protein